MSDKNSQPSTEANTDLDTSKPASSGDDDTHSKTASTQNVPKSSGHEETGIEKFGSSGGSGGQPMRTGQGYEHLAQHQ
ncbi:hypothetical protein I4U23_013584 [Adineta vaga]|nr:hypothetical protein I4U23_013584 [Adineta vaga]